MLLYKAEVYFGVKSLETPKEICLPGSQVSENTWAKAGVPVWDQPWVCCILVLLHYWNLFSIKTFVYSANVADWSTLKPFMKWVDFFNKIILQGLFSLRSVGDVHVKNVVFGGHTFVFYFKIMHITFLESRVEMLQSLSPPVHWRVQDTDFLMYIDKMYMCKFLSNPAPSMGKDCPLSRRKVMKDILYSW